MCPLCQMLMWEVAPHWICLQSCGGQGAEGPAGLGGEENGVGGQREGETTDHHFKILGFRVVQRKRQNCRGHGLS